MARRITWWEAAETIGICCRQMRRWRQRYEEEGFDGLRDRGRGRPSEKRVPLAQAEEVLRLYQEQYFDFNVRHSPEFGWRVRLYLRSEEFDGIGNTSKRFLLVSCWPVCLATDG